MPKTKISEYSATANSNTDVASINIDEGCAPSGINNAIRAVMGHLKDFQQGTNGDPFNGPVNGTLGATTASTANVTTLTTSSTVTHNGGAANGVAYLNGSKVLTTGSALVFDGSNLGLGVTPSGNYQIQTPLNYNTSGKGFNISNVSGGTSGNGVPYIGYNFRTTATADSYTYNLGDVASAIRFYDGIQFKIAASGSAGGAITFTQAMTLDASGNLLVGATSTGTVGSSSGFAAYSDGSISAAYSSNRSISVRRSTDGSVLEFRRDSTAVGSISVTTTATAYNTSSDYRLKNITGSVTGTEAKNFIMALQPKQGTWKVDGSKFVGFVAHEFQEVSPSSVSGVKDAVDKDGNPIMQAMQASSSEVMANLIALVQEQQALITQLTARITALEGA